MIHMNALVKSNFRISFHTVRSVWKYPFCIEILLFNFSWSIFCSHLPWSRVFNHSKPSFSPFFAPVFHFSDLNMTNGSETWVMTKTEEYRFKIFGRAILRRFYVSNRLNENWWKWKTAELHGDIDLRRLECRMAVTRWVGGVAADVRELLDVRCCVVAAFGDAGSTRIVEPDVYLCMILAIMSFVLPPFTCWWDL